MKEKVRFLSRSFFRFKALFLLYKNKVVPFPFFGYRFLTKCQFLTEPNGPKGPSLGRQALANIFMSLPFRPQSAFAQFSFRLLKVYRQKGEIQVAIDLLSPLLGCGLG